MPWLDGGVFDRGLGCGEQFGGGGAVGVGGGRAGVLGRYSFQLPDLPGGLRTLRDKHATDDG
jgi:hypothetical protein